MDAPGTHSFIKHITAKHPKQVQNETSGGIWMDAGGHEGPGGIYTTAQGSLICCLL